MSNAEREVPKEQPLEQADSDRVHGMVDAPAAGHAPATERPPRWDEIVAAASAEFRLRGYEGTSVRDIASRVGILKGSLYNYITKKTDLFVAVVEKPATRLLTEVQNLVDDERSSVEKMRSLIAFQIQTFSEYFPAPFVYLARTKNRLDPRFDEWDDEYLSTVELLLAQGVERGEFRNDLDVEMTARALIGMLAWMMAWYEPRDVSDDGRIAEAFWRLFCRGVESGSRGEHFGATWRPGQEHG